MNGREWFDACQQVADDHEHDALEKLAIRAGLLWQCEGHYMPPEPAGARFECRWVNVAEAVECENCGTNRLVEVDS